MGVKSVRRDGARANILRKKAEGNSFSPCSWVIAGGAKIPLKYPLLSPNVVPNVVPIGPFPWVYIHGGGAGRGPFQVTVDYFT